MKTKIFKQFAKLFTMPGHTIGTASGKQQQQQQQAGRGGCPGAGRVDQAGTNKRQQIHPRQKILQQIGQTGRHLKISEAYHFLQAATVTIPFTIPETRVPSEAVTIGRLTMGKVYHRLPLRTIGDYGHGDTIRERTRLPFRGIRGQVQ